MSRFNIPGSSTGITPNASPVELLKLILFLSFVLIPHLMTGSHLSLTRQMGGSHVYSNSSFGEVNECMSQLDWLNNRIVKGTGTTVPNVKQKPKIKFREFLTIRTSLNSFCSSLFISLHPPIDKKAWHHIFSSRNLYHHRTLAGHLIHLKPPNNRVLLHSILLPLSISPTYSVILHQQL